MKRIDHEIVRLWDKPHDLSRPNLGRSMTMIPRDDGANWVCASPVAPGRRARLGVYDVASPRIDLRTHRGVHPRIGAVDVALFVPVHDASMTDCVELAGRLGHAVRFAVPVNLDTDDIEAARAIAGTIRERDGGLPGVKSLGARLEHRGIVQVSVNLTDYTMTPIH